MKFISLFAGIGGLDLGLERAGMECVAQVEIDDFCQKVLAKHWANVPKFKDVRDVGKHNLPTAELICGGFPCQDVSLAGNQKGLEGTRSTLWAEYARIICEIQPRWVVAENVTGLFGANDGRFFGRVLGDLDAMGYHAEWGVISASSIGAPHFRERVFIIAYPDQVGGEISNKPIAWRSLSRDWVDMLARTWQATKPAMVRMDDGLPTRLDKSRVAAMGNAVVPQVAEFIGNCVMKAETCLTNA